ncbi:uncharacterized protein [Porites lutea]|uniref:uncharacterized protein n=1 Tax=Porites lutea TaxID=51062 RepID=UPI003CC60665
MKFKIRCETAEGLEFTRISVIDESFNVIYDTLVKPTRPIIDYKTKFSGITKKTLENVTTSLDDVQKCLIDLLPHDTILIRHSLENDLRALKLHHRRVIDTSVLYDSSSGPLFKSSLKCLTKQFLNKKIQNGLDGHCSIGDAKACMELVQLKIKNGKFVYFIFTREQISDSVLCFTRLENPSFRAGVVLYYANSQNYQQENA